MKHNPYALPRVPTLIGCKCCFGPAHAVGVVDFSRCGADIQAHVMKYGGGFPQNLVVTEKVDPFVGWPIYYYRCQNCGFTFTPALDDWTTEEFERHIYNDDYVRHDPGYDGTRQIGWSQSFDEWFGHCKAKLSMIDYGAGMGILEKMLKERGFKSVKSYDPYVHKNMPKDRVDLIFSNEVFEHTTDPRGMMDILAKLLKDDGVILFTTMCITDTAIANGIANWHYCVPRGGHVAFYTPQCLANLAYLHGWHYKQIGESFHMYHNEKIPEWFSGFYTMVTTPQPA